MRAVQFDHYGDSDVLHVAEVAAPHPAPDQLRIRVVAAGVNGVDWKVRAGRLQEFMPLELPAGVGIDAAGVVEEVGSAVRGVKIGDAVFGSGTETYADHAVLDVWAVKPAQLPFAEAAGYGISVATARRLLDLARVSRGQTVVVNGASGGVGSALVQFASADQARVIGIAGESNRDYVMGLGAIFVVYGPNLAERVREAAGGTIHAAFDIAGSGVIPELVELTGDASQVVSIADFSAGQYGAVVSSGGGDRSAALAEAARLFIDEAFHIPVTETFALDQADAAHRASETGHVTGRRVLLAQDPPTTPSTEQEQQQVTTIVHFSMPSTSVDKFFAFWQTVVRPSVERQPGLIDGIFHRYLDPDGPFQFINVAHWESAALLHSGVRASIQELADDGTAMLDVFRELNVAVSQNNYTEAVHYPSRT